MDPLSQLHVVIWKRLFSHDYIERAARVYMRKLHNRAVLALMHLTSRKGLSSDDLPEALAGSFRWATDTTKTKRAKLLEEAFE